MRNWLNYNSGVVPQQQPNCILFKSLIYYFLYSIRPPVSYWITLSIKEYIILIRRLCRLLALIRAPFPFDVGADFGYCLIAFILCICDRVKSVLLIILLSADMICEVATNEFCFTLLLFTRGHFVSSCRYCTLWLANTKTFATMHADNEIDSWRNDFNCYFYHVNKRTNTV
jgi:hypothetical protein